MTVDAHSGNPAASSVHRFNGFEFKPATGELRADGCPVRLPPQPATLLEALVERPNEVVSRSALTERLWPDGGIGADQAINSCVRQLRHILGDDASTPRFIETVPRRGYRFVAETSAHRSWADLAGGSAVRAFASSSRRLFRRSGRVAFFIAIAAVAVLFVRRAADAGAQTYPVTVAVLPFEVVGSSPEAIELASGLTTEVTTALAGNAADEFVILSSLEARGLRDSNEPLYVLGNALGVAYAIDGTVQGEGDQLRVSVQMLSVHDGRQSWAAQYDSSVERSGLPWQASLAEDISRAVRARLAP